VQSVGTQPRGRFGAITKMRRSLLMCALVIGGLLGPIAAPASASTQVVRFSAGSWHCPNSSVYDITHVDVFGPGSSSSSWSGRATTASVAIGGVPAGGASVYVAVTYHCNVWGHEGYGEPANGNRWVYGSGSQPSYTL
jgi:hypothetical protein